jgi:predicted transcriptional regulator
MTDAAIKATYHTYNRILGRKVLQIVLEVPLEQEGQVHTAIGYPSPDGSTWVAIARLNEGAAKVEKPKRSWSELSRAQQAGIACDDPEFRKFLIKRGMLLENEEAAEAVRDACNVATRSALDTNATAAGRWDRLYSDFQMWKQGAAA